MTDAAAALQGTFYRAIPAGLTDPLEAGFSLAGGRYNPPSQFSVLYLCDSESRAADEADLRFDRRLYAVSVHDLPRIVTLDARALAELQMSPEEVTRPRTDVAAYESCRRLGLEAFAAGATGLRVPSALEPMSEGWNLALFSPRLIGLAGLTATRL